jgi:hypothetical protein
MQQENDRIYSHFGVKDVSSINRNYSLICTKPFFLFLTRKKLQKRAIYIQDPLILMPNVNMLEMFKNYMDNQNCVSLGSRKYYVLWVEKFLSYMEENSLQNTVEIKNLKDFLRLLIKDSRFKAWQISQAADAIVLFLKMIQENNGDKVNIKISWVYGNWYNRSERSHR